VLLDKHTITHPLICYFPLPGLIPFGRVLSFSDCFIIICLRRNPANSIKPTHSKKSGTESHGAKAFSQPGCRRLRLSDYASRVTESCTVMRQ